MRRNFRRLNREIGQVTQKLGPINASDATSFGGIPIVFEPWKKNKGGGLRTSTTVEVPPSAEKSDGQSEGSADENSSMPQITVKTKGKRKPANLSGEKNISPSY